MRENVGTFDTRLFCDGCDRTRRMKECSLWQKRMRRAIEDFVLRLLRPNLAARDKSESGARLKILENNKSVCVK